VLARVLQHHALLGAMLSQRSLAHVAVQDTRFLGSERLQLLCCGSLLSTLLIRLVAVVDRHFLFKKRSETSRLSSS
jgi:hypothetical protein